MIQTTQDGDTLVAKPQGDIVASTLEDFRRELLEIVDAGHTQVAIDLESVTMIDSKGLAVFAVLQKTLAKVQGSLTVVTTNVELQKLFHVTRLDRHFAVQEAL